MKPRPPRRKARALASVAVGNTGVLTHETAPRFPAPLPSPFGWPRRPPARKLASPGAGYAPLPLCARHPPGGLAQEPLRACRVSRRKRSRAFFSFAGRGRHAGGSLALDEGQKSLILPVGTFVRARQRMIAAKDPARPGARCKGRFIFSVTGPRLTRGGPVFGVNHAYLRISMSTMSASV